jgi:hypothetical protein
MKYATEVVKMIFKCRVVSKLSMQKTLHLEIFEQESSCGVNPKSGVPSHASGQQCSSGLIPTTPQLYNDNNIAQLLYSLQEYHDRVSELFGTRWLKLFCDDGGHRKFSLGGMGHVDQCYAVLEESTFQASAVRIEMALG